MKLRMKGNSIRLRLGPREVEQLVRTGSVAEETRFGPGMASLSYVLAVAADAPAVWARFDGGLRVVLPVVVARRWAGSADEVSITGSQDAGDGDRLTILVEKDFECLHGQEADDAFPNPEHGGAAAESKGLAGAG